MSLVHFITPLAAKDSVKNWRLTCELLRQSLGSLENQTSAAFKATVCCHDLPEFARELDSRFNFVTSPYPPPSDAQTLRGGNSGLRDQTLKRDIALLHSGAEPDDLVMLLDADDLYHKSLVGVLENISVDVKGVVIPEGFEFCYQSKRMVKRKDINHRTASSFGLRAKLLNIPISHSETELSKSLYREVWHSNVEAFLQTNHLKHVYLRGPKTVYVTNTSLNFSDFYRTTMVRKLKHWGKFYLIGRRLTQLDRTEFGITR
jgi:hypothetical protein